MRIVLLILLLTGSVCLAFDHDYTNFGSLLAKHVYDGRVDYYGMLENRAALDTLLSECSKVTFEEYKTFSRSRQLAFMINLYNAATLVLILDNYPVESIKDIGGFFTSPWNLKFISLFDHKVGLGHIEHDILRPEFDDVRIHFAIASASLGCPHLINEPYLPEKLEQQLNEAEANFMTGRPAANDYRNDNLHLSPIFKWFADDFGGRIGVLNFAQRYFPEVTADTKIIYTDYDWNLNSR